jgi:hypothetical protein
MSCRVFFEALPTGDDVGQRAVMIDANHPEGVCQAESVSEYSGVPVSDDEHLFRYIFSPIHLEDDGSVKAAAFSDVSNKGLSCDRGATAIPSDVIHGRGVAQARAFNVHEDNRDKEARAYLGVVWACCRETRSLTYDDGTHAFAVYDTAKSDNSDHTDVFQIFGNTRPSQQKRLRKELRDKFTRYPTAPVV